MHSMIYPKWNVIVNYFRVNKFTIISIYHPKCDRNELKHKNALYVFTVDKRKTVLF